MEAKRIFVTAKTNARKETVECLDTTHFSISVRAAPIDGKANQSIRKALARYLGISPTSIALKSGISKRRKVFEIR